MTRCLMPVAVVCVVFALGMCRSSYAVLPPEVRKELLELKKQATDVNSMLRKEKVDEAKEALAKIEERLAEMMIEEGEKDRGYTSLKTLIDKAKLGIPVSFEREVAPVLTANCTGCHGATQSAANLRLDTFNNMAKGGRSGALLVPRRALNSLIMARVMTPDDQARMPKTRPRLAEGDINTLGRWIEQGAKFDGEDMDAPIGDSLIEKKPPVKVVMADGTETVSFTKDVAPWLVNICLGCHNANNKRGGFSMATFEELLSGGDTGDTIVPGKSGDSYICDLIIDQQPIKMPAGQALLKRSQAMSMKKWIDEGAHFDGTDSKAPLRSLVPTDAELEAARLAAMSETDFRKRREDQAKEIWKRVSPREEGNSVTTSNLIVHGNAEETRLLEFANWGEAHIKTLTGKYQLADGESPWRGRLIVFIGKDRFDYEEFNTVLMNGRRTPRSVSGHAVVTPSFDTVYVALHDVGDETSADELSGQQLLCSLLSQAYLGRDGAALPDWLLQGFGLLESGLAPDSAFVKAIPERAGTAVGTITDAATIFNNGTFAPDEVGAVGFLLVRFLLKYGGVEKVQQLVQELRANPNAGRAIQQTYGQNAGVLGQAFLRSGGR